MNGIPWEFGQVDAPVATTPFSQGSPLHCTCIAWNADNCQHIWLSLARACAAHVSCSPQCWLYREQANPRPLQGCWQSLR